MQYYKNKIIKGIEFQDAIDKVTEALKSEGFGVLTEIDVRETFRKKLDIDYKPYKILGACNPEFAHKALQAEDKIGTMLPCNVIVQQHESGDVEIAVVDPVASMQAVENPSLHGIATDVRNKLNNVLNKIESQQ